MGFFGKKKTGKGKWILLAIIALMIVAVIIAGMQTEWFGFYGPLTKSGIAAAKLTSAGSFTAKFTISMESLNADGRVHIQMDLKNRILNARGTMDLGLMELEFGIYKGKLLIWSGDYPVQVTDINEELLDLFASYEKQQNNDVSLKERIQSFIDSIGAENTVDAGKLSRCILPAFLEMNRTPWLEEHMNLTVKESDGGMLYTFRPDPERVPASVLPYFKKAFVTEECYESTLRELEAGGALLEDRAQPVVALGISQQQLSSLKLELLIMDRKVALDVEFSDVGKTTVDTLPLEEMVNRHKTS